MDTPRTQSAQSSVHARPDMANGEPREPPAHPHPFSFAEIAFLIGVPLAWAVVLLFHATGEGEDFYPIVKDEVTAFVAVHVGTLIFVPLMAAVVYLLLRGVEGTAAHVSRGALAPFVLFYATWEALIGIGVGLLSDEVNGLPAAEQPAAAKALEGYADSGFLAVFELLGMVALLVALTAAGIALWRRAGASLAVPILLVLATIPIGWHVTPFGQVGLALFIAAVVLVVRARTAQATPAAAARPTTASSRRDAGPPHASTMRTVRPASTPIRR